MTLTEKIKATAENKQKLQTTKAQHQVLWLEKATAKNNRYASAKVYTK